MLYALTITIAAGLALLALFAGAALLARRFATEGGLSLPIPGWRWYPSPIGLLLIPIAALVLWRFFPALVFLPIILPFVLRRGLGGIFRFPGRQHGDKDDHGSNGNSHRRPPWAS